ncbi:MAG: hypothetical protein ACFFDQ_12520 [Candidatus Thorarchaeota archaeon]
MGLFELIERWASLRNLVAMIFASFIVVMIMGMLTQTWVYAIYGEVTMPDTRLAYSINEITDAFNTLGQEGLNVWAQAHMLDFLFPLTYMFAMAFGVNLELRKLYPENLNARKLVLIPLLGGIADYVENILILTQIAAYPNLTEGVIIFASGITTLKWVLLGLGFVIIFALIVLAIYRKLQS